METESLARALKEQKLVLELNDDHIAFLAGCTSNARFAGGDYLFREGDEADRLYLVRQGKVSLEIHGPPRGTTVVETLHAGELMGWSALFQPYRWHTDGRATKDTVAFAIDGECLRSKLASDHSFGYAFTRLMLREVHRRLERTRLQVLDVYGGERQKP